MKKLLALLMACATMTCAFASCGDEKEESSSGSSSVSESSVTETTTEEETTEVTTEAESTTIEEAAETTTGAVETPTYEFIEDADKTPFIGKWECTKLVVEGEEMTDLMGIPLYAVFQLEIKDDGTAVMAEAVAEMSDSEEALTYTWGVVSDTEIAIVNPDNAAMLFTLSEDYLIGTEEGYDEQLYLEKVDEFTPFDMESFINDFQLEGTENTSDENTVSDGEDATVEEETSGDLEGESAESVAPSAE